MEVLREYYGYFDEVTETLDEGLQEKLFSITKNAIEAGDLKLSVPTERKSDFSLGNAVKYKENGSYGVSLIHETKVDDSYYVVTVVLDEDMNIIRHQEISASKINSNEVAYEHYINNRKKNSGVLDINEMDAKLNAQPRNWISCMNKCLADQGIPNWLIGVFMALCAAACGTVILCVACIEGPLLAYSLQISYCINRC